MLSFCDSAILLPYAAVLSGLTGGPGVVFALAGQGDKAP